MQHIHSQKTQNRYQFRRDFERGGQGLVDIEAWDGVCQISTYRAIVNNWLGICDKYKGPVCLQPY